MRKKIAVLGLVLVLAMGLVACGGSSGQSNGEAEAPLPETQGIESREGADAVPENSGEDQKTVGAGDLGNYHVEIKSASLAEDYEGNPAIIITYSWTNNSEDTTSAMVSVAEKAFQDGVQLDTAMLIGVDGYESGSGMKEVRPGTAIDVQCAFVLSSETAEVEFEISEWISFSDDVVVMNFDPANLT